MAEGGLVCVVGGIIISLKRSSLLFPFVSVRVPAFVRRAQQQCGVSTIFEVRGCESETRSMRLAAKKGDREGP